MPSKTPLRKKNVVEGDKLIDTHGAYLDSPRNVAKELNVPFIDMNKLTHDLVEGLGPRKNRRNSLCGCPPTQLLPCLKVVKTILTSIYGARVIAGITVDAIAKEVPELAKYVRHYDFVVAQDGSGDFFTVQEAINAVPDFRRNVRTTILVRKGVYKEKLIVPESKINISLIGQGRSCHIL